MNEEVCSKLGVENSMTAAPINPKIQHPFKKLLSHPPPRERGPCARARSPAPTATASDSSSVGTPVAHPHPSLPPLVPSFFKEVAYDKERSGA